MGKGWLRWEDQILRDYYYTEGSKGCHKRLLHRTREAIKAQTHKLNIKGKLGQTLRDLTGEIFTDWKVLARGPDYIAFSGKHRTRWWCECKCGSIKLINSQSLTGGKSKSCGHCNDIVLGKIYNEWIEPIERVEDYVSPLGKHYFQYKCRCHYDGFGCKGTFVTRALHLKNGASKSCGCFTKERVRRICLEMDGKTNPARKLEGSHITPLKEKYYSSRKYYLIKNKCFDRDNNCCIIKGKLPRKLLTIHHKKPRRVIWRENNIKTWKDVLNCKELWDLNNLVTISEEWHLGIKTENLLALHRFYPGRIYVAEDFESWLKEIRKEDK